MRLMKSSLTNDGKNSLKEFDKWLLNIGNVTLSGPDDHSNVSIPEDISVSNCENSIGAIIDAIYDNLLCMKMQSICKKEQFLP